MPNPYLVAANGRRFAGFATAVLVVIIDPANDRFLLLESPAKRGRPGWEVVNGAVDEDETLETAAYREVAEEAGADVGIRLLATVHAYNWRYDDVVTELVSIVFVAEYLGGEVTPGDDMAGCAPRWFSLDELRAVGPLIPAEIGIFEKALRDFHYVRSGNTIERS